jgi:DNA-binding NarL/FixJ family response regulator
VGRKVHKYTIDWQVVSANESETRNHFEMFGERYGFTPSEKEVLRLHALLGYQDEKIMTAMQISPITLDNRLSCMLGKTRTHSVRELQALFIRYILQKLPA